MTGSTAPRGRPSWKAVALDAWPAALALMLVAPLLTGRGLPLAADLVFVPRQPWTDATFGLSGAAPRAVPLDAVVSVLSLPFGGGVLARVAVPVVLAAAGWGAHRLLLDHGTAARLAAGGLAVWNPFVVERLALGQWALLAAYAALPWLIAAAWRWRGDGDPRDLGSLVLWTAVASLTPTGGLIAVGTVVVFVTGVGARRWAAPLVFGLLLQLTWIVPGLVGAASGVSDPAGVAAFAARAEGPGGALTALVGMGGIWDSLSVPATRETWLSTATAVVVAAVWVVGIRSTAGQPGRDRLAAWGGAGLLLAAASATPAGAEAVRWLVAEVPGTGLVRDAQKLLAPFVVATTVWAGAATERGLAAVRLQGTEARWSLALVAIALPLALLPDAATVTWRTVDPVRYPPDFDRVVAALDAEPGSGSVVTLPWRSYRLFGWGGERTASDPAVRLLDREVVAADDLVVGSAVVRGESSRARAVGKALGSGPPARVLGEQGVAWVLVYLDDPEADRVDVSGMDRLHEGRWLALYRVPEPVADPPVAGLVARVVTGAAGIVALAVALLGAALRTRRRSVPGDRRAG